MDSRDHGMTTMTVPAGLAIPRQRTVAQTGDAQGAPLSMAPRPTRAAARSLYSGPAFTTWAVTLAVAVLVHEWAAVERPWSMNMVAGLAALAVLLRPGAVWRVVLLGAVAFAEFIQTLPTPYNDQLLIALTGAVITVWWLVTRLRDRRTATDPAAVFERVAPFLRGSFLVAAFAAAFARLNTGFLDTLGTCAPKLLDAIPLLHVPEQSYPALAVAMLTLRFAIPGLLLFRRTRCAGVVVGLGYATLIALSGDPSLSSSLWAFLLVFLPAGTLARAAATVRSRVLRYHWRRYSEVLRSPLTWLLLSGLFAIGLSVMQIAPTGVARYLHQWVPGALGLLWLMLWAWLLLRHRSHWLRAASAHGLRVRSVLLGAGLVLIAANAASPYVGLKTQYSFVEWSNLRTEPGLWNHLLVPEAVRVFGLQDGRVRLVEAGGPPRLVETIDKFDEEQLVLADARRLVAAFGHASLYYEMDGMLHLAAPVADDPVLGTPQSAALNLLGAFRRIPVDNSCQH